ncbi:MAG: HAMP domain-containing sensor histidine kinase [Campylobacterota bacterium]|nr:HAMP domain-containing sensor histidine kinase [Campylobacterota bacterium]
MGQDENQKLLDDINRYINYSHIPKLHESSYLSLVEATQELVKIYHSQKRKNATLKKINTDMLQKADKRHKSVNAESSKKSTMLVQQSKMAAMGEMMDAVAHQWKQPLNSISMMNDMIKDDFKDGLVDEAYIDDMTETTHMQIEHMVNTLNEFRSFFRPSKESKDFHIEECISSVQVLMKDELLKNTIEVTIDIQNNFSIHGLINEFKHLFLNLISNSIDAFNEKVIQNRKIVIKTFLKDNKAIIEFEDNASGIPEHVIANIFKPNVTTKSEGKGTGIGLYMSSQIVQKHHGTLEVKNSNIGALFSVTIKL